jgi:hypothetical protein
MRPFLGIPFFAPNQGAIHLAVNHLGETQGPIRPGGAPATVGCVSIHGCPQITEGTPSDLETVSFLHSVEDLPMGARFKIQLLKVIRRLFRGYSQYRYC